MNNRSTVKFFAKKESMLSRLTFLSTLVFLSILPVSAQFKWVENQIRRALADTIAAEKPRFIAYPTVAFTPETSWEFGISSLLLFHAKRDTTNRLSEISAFGFVTLENQYGLWLDNALYSNKNRWFVLGRVRWQQFPLYYFGNGPNSIEDSRVLISSEQLVVRQRFLRRLGGKFYTGLETDFQQLTKVNASQTLEEAGLPSVAGIGGSQNLGIGWGLVYDTRYNILNVRDGLFAEMGFLRYDDSWGSDFEFTSYFVESRWFKPVGHQQVFAAQVYGFFTDGNVPFNQLGLMGGETIMRGYYTGRYRDRNYLAAQVEYRWLPLPFSKRFGATIFAGLGTVSHRFNELSFTNAKWSAGLGARYLLFPKKDVFTRFDVGFTEEGNGFYLYIGEAF